MNRSLMLLALVPMVLILSCSILAAQATDSQKGALDTVQMFVKALEIADLDLMLSTFDKDATVFMPVPPSPARLSGTAQIREAFANFFATVRARGSGPPYMSLTPRDEAVQSFGDIVIVTFHLSTLPTQPVQQPVNFARRTFVLRRVGDRWLIVHLHGSTFQITPARP